MEDFKLLVDLHKDGYRQGPGGDTETELAIKLSGLDTAGSLNILDVGCGTGASTMVLASHLDCQITAIDIFDDFLTEATHRSTAKGLDSKIRTRKCSMEDLPFSKEEFDVIWGEGSVYNMGFARSVAYLRDFLKQNGILAVSEITWLSEERPKELEDHWNSEYPEMATASEKMNILETNGFSILGYFPLPRRCWEENFYAPMRSRFPAFLQRNQHSEAAKEIVSLGEKEMELFNTFHQHYGYGFYLAKKL